MLMFHASYLYVILTLGGINFNCVLKFLYKSADACTSRSQKPVPKLDFY